MTLYKWPFTWQINAGQSVEDDQTYYQEFAKGEEEAAEQAAPDLNGGRIDVLYASIDFSALRRKNPKEAEKKQQTRETEYAEIKRDVKEKTEKDGGEEGDVLERAMLREDDETTRVPREDDGEDAEVYSNVKDIMAETWGLLHWGKSFFTLVDCYPSEWTLSNSWALQTFSLCFCESS